MVRERLRAAKGQELEPGAVNNVPGVPERPVIRQFETLGAVVGAIDKWIREGVTIELSDTIQLDRTGLQDLAHKLGSRQTARKAAALSGQFTRSAVVQRIVAGRFFNDLPWGEEVKRGGRRRNKKLAEAYASDFLTTLANVDVVIPDGRQDRQDRQSLTQQHLDTIAVMYTPDQADDGSKLKLVDVKGSVARQLDNPLTLVGDGLHIHLDGVSERDFTLPVLLLEIFKDLKNIYSAEALQDWIVNNCVYEGVLDALTAKIEFLMFLDDETRYSLWWASGNKMYLLPFQALVKGVDGAIKYFEEDIKQPIPETLSNARERLKLRFSQVTTMNLIDGLAVEPIMLQPNPKDLATLLMDDYTRSTEMGFTEERAARYFAKTVQQIDPNMIRRLIGHVRRDWEEESLAELIYGESVKLGLIQDEVEIQKIRREILDRLKSRPWRDFAEMDVADLVPEGATNVHFHVLTCTLGPGHQGHEDLIRRELALIRHLEEIEKAENVERAARGETPVVTKRYILVLPIVGIEELHDLDPPPAGDNGYSKSYDLVGSEYERLGSLMLLLADLDPEDREKVLMTTKTQPPAVEAGSVENAVDCAMLMIGDRLNDRFDSEFPFSYSLFMGSDELRWEEDNKLKRVQRAKLTENPAEIAVRHGHLIHLLEGWEQLKEYTRCTSIMLTTDSPNISSTVIRGALDKGDYSLLPPISAPFLVAHWCKQARDLRRADLEEGIAQAIPVHTVTEICQKLIDEFEVLIEEDKRLSSV